MAELPTKDKMNIKDTLVIELDDLGEFSFDIEIELEWDEGDIFMRRRDYYCELVDCELEGTNTETGEILSFSPEIFDILKDNFDSNEFAMNYFYNRKEDSYRFDLLDD